MKIRYITESEYEQIKNDFEFFEYATGFIDEIKQLPDNCVGKMNGEYLIREDGKEG